MNGKGRKIKILQIACGFRKGVSGGVPSFVHSYRMGMDALGLDVNMAYLSLGYQCYEPYRKDFESLGESMAALGIHSSGIKRLKCITDEIKRYVSKNDFDIVHVNTGSLPQMCAAVKGAKLGGCSCVIAHSHNAKPVNGARKTLYAHMVSRLPKYADRFFACSELAANSMFPHEITGADGKWVLVPNAINVKRYRFDEAVRAKKREELGIENKYVIGHVGRFNTQKNHDFLVDVFAEVASMRDDAVLVLAGTGDLEDAVKAKVDRLDLCKRVRFLGQRTDVPELLQAMDVFVFPSLFEGLGISVIEAQAAGLPVFMRDDMPKEANVSDLAHCLPSSASAKEWAETIVGTTRISKRGRETDVISAGYDVMSASRNLYDAYREALGISTQTDQQIDQAHPLGAISCQRS